MKFKKFDKFWLTTLCITLLLSCGVGENTYKTGEEIPASFLQNPEDTQPLIKSGHFNVILFFNSSASDYSLIKYIDNLYHSKYKDLGLRLFLIVKSAGHHEAGVKKEPGFDLPILPFDRSEKALRKFFDPYANERALIVINPGLKLEAVYFFFKEDDVRQLFEKYYFDKITYRGEIEKEKLSTGDLFPGFSIIKLAPGRESYLTNQVELAPRLWFIFRSNCVSCVLNKYLRRYKSLEDKLPGKTGIARALIFSPYFLEDEILKKMKHYKIAAPVYLSQDELRGFEDYYYKDAAAADSVSVVLTNQKNRIFYIAPFPDFVLEWEGGKFEKKFPGLFR
ncbi:MAG: hypothetical protein KAW12_11285 [Candidatus Aminicenantes bacterium]|nr:hypothetical protein [Candidatus Aminicenantes bacterium]